eukprot:CAMPEP_0171304448 /NCGR_PEP_ID=MMETSP0816-20121228/14181_1 /TAXON_ID=420281 /ORGANISM="Proboscia inermis, Strain CCAP1064/1" /LENGTH=255 /DNA_ID=CAMNT_0011784529 /DNA_START=64 /DNA_END=831 /DNA_ORIENTATION=+
MTQLLDISTNAAKPSYPMAPDKPLVLHKCDFNNVTFGYTSQNLWNVTYHLENQWEELVLGAERIKDALRSLQEYAMIDVREDLCRFVQDYLAKAGGSRGRSRKNKKGKDTLVFSYLDLVKLLDESACEQGSEMLDVRPSPANQTPPAPTSTKKKLISWGKALQLMETKLSLTPYPKHHRDAKSHISLMDRSKGSTYEDKVAAILSQPLSGKKRQRFIENQEKDSINYGEGQDGEASKEANIRFYDKMTQLGGSGI